LKVPWPRPRFSTRLAAIAYGILYVICNKKMSIPHKQHMRETQLKENYSGKKKKILLLTDRGAPRIVKTTREAMTMPIGGSPLGR
jgi:hypothetical protein